MRYLPKKKSDVQLTGGMIDFDGTSWKKLGITDVQREFDDRFNDIKKKYDELQDEFYWNKLVYESEIRLEPKIENLYHLYENENGSTFLSIIAPDEWEMDYIGTFKLKYNRKWEKVQ
jgi:hypothetical protein